MLQAVWDRYDKCEHAQVWHNPIANSDVAVYVLVLCRQPTSCAHPAVSVAATLYTPHRSQPCLVRSAADILVIASLQGVYISTFTRRGANLGNKLCKYDKAC